MPAPTQYPPLAMATVFIPTQLRDLTAGAGQLEVPGESLRAIIEGLDQRYPGLKSRLCEEGGLAPGLQASIDQVLTRSMSANVTSTSEIHFLPAIGGG